MKTFFTLTLLLLSFCLFALTYDNCFIKFGVNASGYKDDMPNNYITKFAFSRSFGVKLRFNNKLFLMPEINYQSKGANRKGLLQHDLTHLTVNYLGFYPALYYRSESFNNNVYLGAYPYLGYKTKSIGKLWKDRIEEKIIDIKQGKITNRYDYGFCLSIRLENDITIYELRYEQGLAEVFDKDIVGSKYKNTSLIFFIGLMFDPSEFFK